jgi:hypothetical protein
VKHALRDAFSLVYEHTGQAAKWQKLYYDRGLKVRTFEKDSWVWRWYPPKINQTLGLGWRGPYLVLEKLSDLTYKIQKDENTLPVIVHVDHLKPYLGRNPPQNWFLQQTKLTGYKHNNRTQFYTTRFRWYCQRHKSIYPS